MKNETWLFFSISWTVIGIVVLLPLLCLLFGADNTLTVLRENYGIFSGGLFIISIVLILIPFFSGFHLASILSLPAGAVCSSQMLYMLDVGFDIISNMENYGFGLLNRTILFIIWLIYMLINIVVAFGSMGLGAFFAFGYRSEKKVSANTAKLYSNLGLTVGPSAAVGLIGWIVNWMFL